MLNALDAEALHSKLHIPITTVVDKNLSTNLESK